MHTYQKYAHHDMAAMKTQFDQASDDPWAPRPGTPNDVHPTRPTPTLKIELIDDIAPLGTQFGVFPKKSVPDLLHHLLFGQPEPTDPEIRVVGGDAALVPQMQTYAILDAAKVPNLPELLKESGLEHRCLFKGTAYAELKDVAPWIVRLEDGSVFTRNLFTDSDACWHLWGNEPGIYIRSRDALDDLWRHFRKFTYVRDRSGRMHYLCFWQAWLIKELVQTEAGAWALKQLMGAQDLTLIAIHDGSCVHIQSPGTPEKLTAQQAPDMVALLSGSFNSYQVRKVVREISENSRRDVRREDVMNYAAQVLRWIDAYVSDIAASIRIIRVVAREVADLNEIPQDIREIVMAPKMGAKVKVRLAERWLQQVA